MALAIFDLDNTLLSDDSDYLWGCFLTENGIVDAKYYESENDRFYEEYKQGKLDIMEFLHFSLKPLSQHPIEKLNKWHQQFMQQKIKPLITSKAIQLVDKHRQQGDTLMIITATNQFVTGPIAKYLDIPHLIATIPAQNEQGYTGEVEGIPSFQDGKVSRLQSWLNEHNETLDNSWFYSDSHNDLPLLKKVTHPVAVDPDDKLKSIAVKNNWPVISLR